MTCEYIVNDGAFPERGHGGARVFHVPASDMPWRLPVSLFLCLSGVSGRSFRLFNVGYPKKVFISQHPRQPSRLPSPSLPSHLSPATQTLLGLLEALSLLLLFAIDSDNGSRDTNGDGEDRVESSELKRNNQKGTWLVGTLY
jgi:hypothetical protein